MDGVRRILVLSFTARTRNASRGREAPEEWASLLAFFANQSRRLKPRLGRSSLLLLLPLFSFSSGASAMDAANAPTVRVLEPVDKTSEEYKVFKGMERDFVLKMIEEMRKSVHEDPELANTPGHQIFQSWQNEQYADTITNAQGIGLAEMIVRQLHEQEAAARQYRAMQVRALNKSDVIGK